MNREVVLGLVIVGMIVGGIGIVGTALGQAYPDGALFALAYYLTIILVVRPYVYERFGNHIGDWVIVILIFGPATLLVAPILWWQHRRPDVEESESATSG